MAWEGLFRRFAVDNGFANGATVVATPAEFPTCPPEQAERRVANCRGLIAGARDELARLSFAMDGMPHAYALADTDGVVVHSHGSSPELIGFYSWPVGAEILATPDMRTTLWAGRPAISEGPPPDRLAIYLGMRTEEGAVLDVLGFGCARDCMNERVATAVVQAAKIIALTTQLDQFRQQHEKSMGVIGHELRQPLSALIAALEVIGRNHATPRQRAFEIAQRQSTQLRGLVDSLLDLSRVLSGKLRMTPRLADVRTVVSLAVESVRNDIESRRQTLEVDLPGSPVWCLVDAPRLQQVFVNLLTNAQRYTPEGGEIRVRLECGDDVEVSVNDNGPGIDPRARERIFQPFAQEADAEHGLGLGLSISRRIVELQGGRLDVKTGDGGVGSRFVVGLPCAVEKMKDCRDSVRARALR